MTNDPINTEVEALPGTFPISVIMQASPSDNPWLETHWEAIGILAGRIGEVTEETAPEVIHDEEGSKHYLYRGYRLKLYNDECESYYHNLMSPNPLAYVIATEDDDGRPQPLMISLSFDEAHAYLEGDETLYTVPIPPEIYRWSEAFVINHYVPEKRTKRKRQDWRQAGRGNHP